MQGGSDTGIITLSYACLRDDPPVCTFPAVLADEDDAPFVVDLAASCTDDDIVYGPPGAAAAAPAAAVRMSVCDVCGGHLLMCIYVYPCSSLHAGFDVLSFSSFLTTPTTDVVSSAVVSGSGVYCVCSACSL